MLTDKELALLGDGEAQERLTEAGVLLECPFCGGTPTKKVQNVEYGLSGTIIRCNKCGAYLYSPDKRAELANGAVKNMPIKNHTKIAFQKWNSRSLLLTPTQMALLGIERKQSSPSSSWPDGTAPPE